MLVTALVAIAETIYVGILGTTQLAAIALVFPMVMLMQMLSAGAMGGGVSSAISRALGAGDEARAEALALHALAIGAAAGSAFSAAVRRLRARHLLGRWAAAAPCSSRRSPTPAWRSRARSLIWLLNTLASIVRGTGNMRVPSLTLLGAAALQIALGGALGLGIGPIPRFGLAGVASRPGHRLRCRRAVPAVVPALRPGARHAALQGRRASRARCSSTS